MIKIIGHLAIVTALMLPSAPASAQSNALATWDGAIHVMGQELPITVTFTAVDKGAIDIQGATGLPLTNVRIAGDAIHFELPAGLGLCVFDGAINGEAISGSFAQGPAKGTFDLKPRNAAPVPPEPPPPYKQEDVKITNGAVTLAGTLTVPPTAGRHPAVVLITGTGTRMCLASRCSACLPTN
jgi:hypothetical protein